MKSQTIIWTVDELIMLITEERILVPIQSHDEQLERFNAAVNSEPLNFSPYRG
jgi:hypothetical protein